MRAQANLVAVAVALVALTGVTVFGVVLADGALAAADREPLERRAAVSTADRLVAADSPLTVRANVLDGGDLPSLTLGRLETIAPALAGRTFRVRLDERVVVARGDPMDGTTVRRVVLVATRSEKTRSLSLAAANEFTLPRRTTRVTMDLRGATGVETVRADGRVVLHDPGGLDGQATVAVSRFETTTLAFEGPDEVGGTVRVTYHPERTTKAVLEVTVGGRESDEWGDDG